MNGHEIVAGLESSSLWVGDEALTSPPRRPSRWQERLAQRLLVGLSPRVPRLATPEVPATLAPYEHFEIERVSGRGRLAATWYPADGRARGAVLLAHPWHSPGRSYFYRRGRLEALRQAGYHALTFDLGGFGGSGPRPMGFYDADLEDALRALSERAGGLPLHFWGTSFGGYFAHPVLARVGGVAGCMFEDVTPHLIEWSKRLAPWGLPCYLFFQHVLRDAYRFLDVRRHAPFLDARAVAYVSGGQDRGIRPQETRELARRAGGEALVVAAAGHLQAMRLVPRQVIELALDTFARSE